MFSATIGGVVGRAHSYYRAGTPTLLLLLLLLLAYGGPARLFFYCSRAHGQSQTQVPSRDLRGWSPLFSENPRRVILGSPLRIDLILYHRFCWLSRGYRVCVPMHYLPGTIFRSQDSRNPHGNRGNIFPSPNLRLVPLHLHNVDKLRGCVLRYVLKADDLAISVMRRGTLHSRSNLPPSTRGRPKGLARVTSSRWEY